MKNKVQEKLSKLNDTITWYQKRGGLLPYDFGSCFLKDWFKLLEMMGLNHFGEVVIKRKFDHQQIESKDLKISYCPCRKEIFSFLDKKNKIINPCIPPEDLLYLINNRKKFLKERRIKK